MPFTVHFLSFFDTFYHMHICRIKEHLGLPVPDQDGVDIHPTLPAKYSPDL